MASQMNKVIGNQPSALIECECGCAHVVRLDLPILAISILCDCGRMVFWNRYPEAFNALMLAWQARMGAANGH